MSFFRFPWVKFMILVPAISEYSHLGRKSSIEYRVKWETRKKDPPYPNVRRSFWARNDYFDVDNEAKV